MMTEQDYLEHTYRTPLNISQTTAEEYQIQTAPTSLDPHPSNVPPRCIAVVRSPCHPARAPDPVGCRRHRQEYKERKTIRDHIHMIAMLHLVLSSLAVRRDIFCMTKLYFSLFVIGFMAMKSDNCPGLASLLQRTS